MKSKNVVLRPHKALAIQRCSGALTVEPGAFLSLILKGVALLEGILCLERKAT